jgi:hypothetical protein
MQQASLSNKHHSTFELRRLSNRRVHLSLQKKQNLEQRKTQYHNHNFMASYLNMGFACIDVNTEHGGDQLRVKEREGGICCGTAQRWREMAVQTLLAQVAPHGSLSEWPRAGCRSSEMHSAARGQRSEGSPIFDGGLLAH